MGARAVVMFLAGGIVGYAIISYYVELFGLLNYGPGQNFGFVVAPAGAIILGIISGFFVRSVVIFAAATLIGYVVVLFGWIGYANLFDIVDRDGGKTMAMIFILAPAGGAMIGLIAASLLSRRRISDASPAHTTAPGGATS